MINEIKEFLDSDVNQRAIAIVSKPIWLADIAIPCSGTDISITSRYVEKNGNRITWCQPHNAINGTRGQYFRLIIIADVLPLELHSYLKPRLLEGGKILILD